MKIIITGGSGLLGQYLNIFLSAKHDVLTFYNHNSGNCKQYKSLKIDLNDNAKLQNVLSDFKPDIVIHTAAYTN